MNRKILIAVAMFASTAYVACGGGGEEGKGPVTPANASVSAAPSPAPSPVESAVAPAPSAAPSPSVSAEPPKPKSLYDRLGGKDAIAKVVDAFVKNIGDDKALKKAFEKTLKDPKKVDHFKEMVNAQLCAATGGPCEYKGKDMKTAHKGMKIKDAEFTAFVEDLAKALDGAGVGKQEKDELLGALAGMKGDMVEEPKGAKPAASASASAAPAKSAAAPAKSAAPAAKPAASAKK